MLRLFVGVPIPAELRARLGMLQAGVSGARWVPPENFHVTLRFIGEVGEDEAHEIDEALAGIAAPRFELLLDGVGQFGTRRKPGTLWAGLRREPALAFLHDKVDRALVAVGHPPDDRNFAAHVTLARLRDAPAERVGRWLAENGLFQAGPFAVDAYHLYRSLTGNEGAVYEVLASYALTARGSPAPLPGA